MKIALAADHGGFALKEEIAFFLKKNGYTIEDFGTYTADSVDYPDYAYAAAKAVSSGQCNFGILVCGTGIGISIAANKVKGIRCAVLSDIFSAKATRQHNDANMMALGARVIGTGLALELVQAFLKTPFSEDARHARRIEKIKEIEQKEV